MRLPTPLILLTVLLAAAAGAPGMSDAAVTTIGPQTLSTGTTNDSFGGTYIQYAGTMPAAPYVSPIEGTIVTWRIASGSSGNEVRLRVLRPAGAGKFASVGTSAAEKTGASPPDTFATSLPIKVGDIVGLDNNSSALIFKEGVLGEFPQRFFPFLVDGGPAAEPKPISGGGNGFELQVNADIQPSPSSPGGGTGSPGNSGGGTPGVGSGGGGVPPPTASALAGLILTPNVLSAARSGASITTGRGRKTGATVSYTDSQAATTTFTVLQRQPGRSNKQGVCVKPQRQPRGKHCTRVVTIGSFTHTDGAGANSFHFTGRVNGQTLKPGSYQLRAVARDASARISRPVATGFRVKR